MSPEQKVCVDCGAPATGDYMGYWRASVPCCAEHLAKRRAGRAEEVRWCQEIDADCNDCRHFEARQDGGQPKWRRVGWCHQKNQPTTAFPLMCTGHECFEHRRGA